MGVPCRFLPVSKGCKGSISAGGDRQKSARSGHRERLKKAKPISSVSAKVCIKGKLLPGVRMIELISYGCRQEERAVQYCICARALRWAN